MKAARVPTSAGELIKLFHEQTAQVRDSTWDVSHLVSDLVPMDPANRPEPFKSYPDIPLQPLNRDIADLATSAADVLSGRVAATAGRVDEAMLARLLFYTAGVTRVAELSGRRVYFRAAPAAGNLHPIEVYVVIGDVDGWTPGLYHFAPAEFALAPLRTGDVRPTLSEAAASPDLLRAPLSVILTALPWRTGWKYGERGYRHVYWDAGTQLANLTSVASAAGLTADLKMGFDDRQMCRLLGVDGATEFPLAIATVGTSEAAPSPSPSVTSRPLESLEHSVAPMSANPREFPLVTKAQRAGELHGGDEVRTWRAGAVTSTAGTSEAIMGRAESIGTESMESLIRRRGSTRLMRHALVSESLLSQGMAVATRPLRWDVTAFGGTLLGHGLSVHSVDGLRPGRYHWVDGALHLVSGGEESRVRRTSQEMCGDQPLGGDSAYTLFSWTDLSSVVTSHGPRGYRAAQLEAGIVAGRLQLAAFLLGAGATGLSFMDEQVKTEFATTSECMLATSVGVPDYVSTSGGGPSKAVELASFAALQDRLMDGLTRARTDELTDQAITD